MHSDYSVKGKHHSFEEALDLTGFGKYNVVMFITSSCILLGMLLDIFGFSIILPSVACDFQITKQQQGLISAVSFIGIMLSSYFWGLLTDIYGRRLVLVYAMSVGMVINFACSFSPNYETLAVLKFCSSLFTASANSICFVLIGETTPKKRRNLLLFLLSAVTMGGPCVASVFALGVFKLHFKIPIFGTGVYYTPWRLLMQIITIPGIIAVLSLWLLKESPKFLQSKDRDSEALAVLKAMHDINKGKKHEYEVTYIVFEEAKSEKNKKSSFLHTIWIQTVPLFRPPLRKNSFILYYLLLTAYMIATGFTMWVPTITNEFLTASNNTGKTFCEIATEIPKRVANSSEVVSLNVDCDHIVTDATLYTVIMYSGFSTTTCTAVSLLSHAIGRKYSTLVIFITAIISGIGLFFVRIPELSIALFCLFAYVALILGNIYSYLVELTPTHLRGMATSLSVVVARGFSFIGIQIIAITFTTHCTYMISGFLAAVISGLIVALFLPSEKQMKKMSEVSIKNNENGPIGMRD